MSDRPQRVQLRRTRGWRKPEGAVVVGRPTQWGNPWEVGMTVAVPIEGGQDWLETVVNPDLAVALFRSWIEDEARSVLRAEVVTELRGHDLACWCALVDGEGNHVPCHADVLLELANA